MFGRPSEIPSPQQALPGRSESMQFDPVNRVLGTSMVAPFPDDCEQVVFGLGCFWGAERKFWNLAGVHTTAVGYAAGHTRNPSYQEVCSGMTGHNEVVLVVFRPAELGFDALLSIFWESHNPTQGMRQGNDQGTQYRSGIYYSDDSQREVAQASCEQYQLKLTAAGYAQITTEILPAGPFYYAEEYHQQYLDKNPAGYCGLGGTGVNC
ncbi:MAG: peptide-methionine (S)-S-oxide reductase MsrA [Gammaproteobacteria bacterium]|jgi:peptide-methionine (S)-S-oxide reductase|nr:peptide-methionine (S)-S-oxide reductase MsrA [Gammaproteobacteria bacterium]